MGSVNTEGGVDFAAAGLAWRLHLYADRFTWQPALGAAVQSGDADQFQRSPEPSRSRLAVLCSSRNSAPVTASLRDGRWRLSYLHFSHAQLAGPAKSWTGRCSVLRLRLSSSAIESLRRLRLCFGVQIG